MANPLRNENAGLNNIERLTREIRNGNASALDQLLQLYGSALIAYSAQRTGDAAVAEEIVQDVFMQLWNERDKLQSDYNLINYLYWLTRNRSIDVIRSDTQARLREKLWTDHIYSESSVASENVALKDIEAIEIRAEVYDLLSAAPPRCREIFMLIWDVQLTYEEVAQKMNISVRTVRNQVSRAVKILGERWKRE